MSNQKLIDLLPGSISNDADMAAMADAVQPQLDDIDELIPSIEIYRRIDELPEKILRMLAWENGLHDVEWTLALTYQDKLNLVKNSFELNKRRGTRWSVERIFELLRLQATIVEWWEEGGPPATFRISILDVSGRGILQSELALLDQLIAMYKPLSRHILGINMVSGIEVESYSHGAASVVATVITSMTEDAKYAAILATSPATLIQFNHAFFNGSQVLWQDLAGTIPVTSPGQPIGRSDCLTGSGAYVFQEVSTRRPIWNGPGLGATWDGVDDFMVANTETIGAYLHHFKPCAFFIANTPHGTIPSTSRLIATKQTTSQTGNGMILSNNAGTRLALYPGSAGAPSSLQTSQAVTIPTEERHVLGASLWEDGGVQRRLFVDAEPFVAGAYPDPAGYPDTSAQCYFTIGAAGVVKGQSTPSGGYMHFTVEDITLYDRQPTPAEIGLQQ